MFIAPLAPEGKTGLWPIPPPKSLNRGLIWQSSSICFLYFLFAKKKYCFLYHFHFWCDYTETQDTFNFFQIPCSLFSFFYSQVKLCVRRMIWEKKTCINQFIFFKSHGLSINTPTRWVLFHLLVNICLVYLLVSLQSWIFFKNENSLRSIQKIHKWWYVAILFVPYNRALV